MKKKSLKAQIYDARWCYVFVFPCLVITGLFVLYPIGMSWYFSLLDWSGFTKAAKFIGFQNYVEAINDQFFWDAFVRSFIFMFGTVPAKIVLGFIIAVFLNNQVLKLAPIFRTIIFMPVVTAIAIIGIVMTFVFSPFNGPANKFLMQTNLTSGPIDFLGNPDTVLPTIMAVYVWKWLGITMMYWLAALQTVPQDVYDAAKIDGAEGIRLWIYIILPIVLPFAIVIILVEAVSALNVFPLIETMTAGGPFFSSEVMEVYIFRTAFVTDAGTMPRLGYACAAGVFWGVAVLFITALQGFWIRRTRKI
tara:strand:- start:797 stop:1711 length:915 start_codon:yes stop_codon:yes gene_type:complete